MRSERKLVTSKKLFRATSYELTSLEIRERALIIADGLTSTVHPNDMTAWYCKAFKTLGESRYTAVANAARQGDNPKKLFGWLLGKEMKRKSL